MRPTLTHLALHVPDLDACIAFYARFCGMRVFHERPGKGSRIVWMAEPGKEREFIFVIMPGGADRALAANDYSHFGFAMASREEVDAVAELAREEGIAFQSASAQYQTFLTRCRRERLIGPMPDLGTARRAVPGGLLLRRARPRGQLCRIQLWAAAWTGCRSVAGTLKRTSHPEVARWVQNALSVR